MIVLLIPDASNLSDTVDHLLHAGSACKLVAPIQCRTTCSSARSGNAVLSSDIPAKPLVIVQGSLFPEHVWRAQE